MARRAGAFGCGECAEPWQWFEQIGRVLRSAAGKAFQTQDR
jgi:hypothetical protein